jgi:hypothetical protein
MRSNTLRRFLASLLPVSVLVGVCTHVALAQQAQPGGQTSSDTDVEITAPAGNPPAATEDLEVSAPAGAPAQTPAAAEPSASTQPPAAGSAASSAQAQAEAFSQRVQTLEQRNAELEGRLQALEATVENDKQRASAPAVPVVLAGDGGLGTHLSGYLQAQYESSQLSEDQLQQGGSPLNRNRFVVRRARLRLDQSWQYAALSVELDGNTTRGAVLGLRRAEGSVLWRNPNAEAIPYGRLTAGLQDTPFGLELPFGDRKRVFMERSQASLAFFPAVPDIGASLSGGVGPARYAFAVLNGQPVDSAGGLSSIDPNRAKDVVGRVGVEATPQPWALIAGGVSFLAGTGFHAEPGSGKSRLQWKDSNEDSKVQPIEIIGVSGAAAKPSRNFERWAVGADVQLGLRTRYGWSRLYAEITAASNLDRGLFVADPVASSRSLRELGYYLGFVQQLTEYGLIGFRSDFYDGDSDFLDKRRGEQVPAKQTIRTYSPLIGVVLPGQARLVFQYDVIVDSLARDTLGIPTNLRNNQWTLRLQVGI